MADSSKDRSEFAWGIVDRIIDLPPEEREAAARRECAGDEPLLAEVLGHLRFTPGPTLPVDDGASEERVAERVQSSATRELLTRLQRAPKLDTTRYEVGREVDRGGMGAILEVRDHQLNRRLAMKVLLERELPRDEHGRELAHQLRGRFLEEAQVTSQLDHPGVVPIHELGLDQHGRVYFTMRLVKGRTAHEVFKEAHAGSERWPLTRALEVILTVCDTMAYAHAKGVIHRDLKPGNVMVGRFGEVYVMDWGLAKILGQASRRDMRIAPRPASTLSHIDSARRRDTERDEDASVVSMDGQTLGTPSYMSPEQARSEVLDPRTDVYSVGAMLYELLTGRAPYTSPGVRKPAYRILDDVADGPPKRVDQIQPGIAPELVAITEKAMARDRERRYRDTAELAADVRAYLAQRAVSAHRTGPIVELKLWVRRNRALAASLLAAAAILVTAIVLTSIYGHEARQQATANGQLATQMAAALTRETSARHRAESIKLGVASEQVAATDPELALILAREAWREGEGHFDARLAAAGQMRRALTNLPGKLLLPQRPSSEAVPRWPGTLVGCNGRWALTLTAEDTATVWSIPQGARVAEIQKPDRAISYLGFVGEGRTVLTMHAEDNIWRSRLWRPDNASAQLLVEFELLLEADRSAVVAAQLTYALCRTADGLGVISLSTGEIVRLPLAKRPVPRNAWVSNDGKRVLLGLRKFRRPWSFDSRDEEQTDDEETGPGLIFADLTQNVAVEHAESYTEGGVDSDLRRVVAPAGTGRCKVLRTERLDSPLTIEGDEGFPLPGQGTILLVRCGEKDGRWTSLIRESDGTELCRWLKVRTEPIIDDGGMRFGINTDGAWQLCDGGTGAAIAQVSGALGSSSLNSRALQFSPSGRLVAVDRGPYTGVLDTETGLERHLLAGEQPQHSWAALDESETILATRDDPGTLLHDLRTKHHVRVKGPALLQRHGDAAVQYNGDELAIYFPRTQPLRRKKYLGPSRTDGAVPVTLDGRLAIVSDGARLVLHDLVRDITIEPFPGTEHDRDATVLSYSASLAPDASLAATAGFLDLSIWSLKAPFAKIPAAVNLGVGATSRLSAFVGSGSPTSSTTTSTGQWVLPDIPMGIQVARDSRRALLRSSSSSFVMRLRDGVCAGKLSASEGAQCVFARGSDGVIGIAASVANYWLSEDVKVISSAPHAFGAPTSLSGSSRDQAISGHEDGTVVLWVASTTTPTVLHSGVSSAAVQVAASMTGDTFAAAFADGTIRVWSPPHGAEPTHLFRQQDPASFLGFSSTSRHLIVGTVAADVTIVDLDTGAPIDRVSECGGPITFAHWDVDESRLVTVCDGAVCTWTTGAADVAATYPTRRLTLSECARYGVGPDEERETARRIAQGGFSEAVVDELRASVKHRELRRALTAQPKMQ